MCCCLSLDSPVRYPSEGNRALFLWHGDRKKKKKSQLVDNLVVAKCICICYLVRVPVRMYTTQGVPMVLFPVNP